LEERGRLAGSMGQRKQPTKQHRWAILGHFMQCCAAREFAKTQYFWKGKGAKDPIARGVDK